MRSEQKNDITYMFLADVLVGRLTTLKKEEAWMINTIGTTMLIV